MGRPKGSKNKPKEERQIVVQPKVTQSSRKRDYEKTNSGDIVYMHRSRLTGAMVAVLRGPAELGIGAGAKWVDMCLAHHNFSIYDARTRATASANKPNEWCAGCAQTANKKRTKKDVA